MSKLPFRDEPETLFVWRDEFAHMRIAFTRPVGVSSTEYRKEKVHMSKGTKQPTEAAEEPTRSRQWPPKDRNMKPTTRTPPVKTKTPAKKGSKK